MRFCSACGAQNDVNAAFCSTCGARSGEAPTQIGGVSPAVAAVAQVGPVTAPGLVGARFIGQWNWGASFLTPWWLMNHRRVQLGIIYIVVSAIPYVNILTLGCLIYFGRNGNRIAVLSGRFTDEAQFVAVQNAWRNWAFGVTAVYLFLAALVVVRAYAVR